MPPSKYDYKFDPDEPNNTAASIFRLVRDAGTRVLDIGSGPGIVAGALVHLADKHVTCLDSEEHHLAAAAERGAQRTLQADLADPAWSDAIAGERYDVIILADILEHLIDPAAALTAIRERDLLTSKGALVISIPNAAHISIVGVLARGDFPYRPTGLLDATHLRFFTLKSIRRLLEEQGFGIDRIVRTTRKLSESELHDVTELLDGELVQRLAAAHEETDTYQYILRARPLRVAERRSVQAELDDLSARLRRARRRRAKLDKQLAQITADRDRTEEGLRSELDRARHDREMAEAGRAELQSRVDELEARLYAMRQSSTWKTGRAIVGIPGAIKRRFR